MNKPQGLNIILFPSSESKVLGSVEPSPLMRVLRPVTFALWIIIFAFQLQTVVSGGSQGSWLVLAVSTVLFVGVHVQFWYEESEQGRRFHHAFERMRGKIYEDDATGLPNGRHFVFELRRQMMRSMRSGRGFSLVLTDITGFEGAKDDQDRILRSATKALRSALGDSDFLARLQGAIFAAVVLDERDRMAAEKADSVVAALGSSIPMNRVGSLLPIVSVTGYEGELEVRDYLRRAQRDLQTARARGTSPVNVTERHMPSTTAA